MSPAAERMFNIKEQEHNLTVDWGGGDTEGMEVRHWRDGGETVSF